MEKGRDTHAREDERNRELGLPRPGRLSLQSKHLKRAESGECGTGYCQDDVSTRRRVMANLGDAVPFWPGASAIGSE